MVYNLKIITNNVYNNNNIILRKQEIVVLNLHFLFALCDTTHDHLLHPSINHLNPLKRHPVWTWAYPYPRPRSTWTSASCASYRQLHPPSSSFYCPCHRPRIVSSRRPKYLEGRNCKIVSKINHKTNLIL